MNIWLAVCLVATHWLATDAQTDLVRLTADDGRGHVWTPEGKYSANKQGFFAELRLNGESSFQAGNHCILSGKLVRVASKPVWQFRGSSADGPGCPDTPGPASDINLTIVDGPGTRASGNASTIRVDHKGAKGRVHFTATYSFDSEL